MSTALALLFFIVSMYFVVIMCLGFQRDAKVLRELTLRELQWRFSNNNPRNSVPSRGDPEEFCRCADSFLTEFKTT